MRKIYLCILTVVLIFTFLPTFVFGQDIPYRCVRKYDIRYGYVPCEFEGPGGGGGYFDPFQWLGITPEGFMGTVVVSLAIFVVMVVILKIIFKIQYRHVFTPPPTAPPPPPQPPPPPIARMPSQLPPTKIRPKRGPIFGPKSRQGRGKAKWAQSPPYPRYEAAPEPPYRHEIPPSSISPGGQPIGGAGLAYFQHAYPPVQNMRISRHGRFVDLKWDQPANDPAKGELVGYDIYRYEDVPHSTGKEYKSLATISAGATAFQILHKKGSENYGVNPIYRTFPEGRIIVGSVPE